MAQKLEILNSKEKKVIYAQLLDHYGYVGPLDMAFLRNDKKEKLFIFTNDLAMMDISNLRIDTMGLYVAAQYDGMLRFSIDGSQIFGPRCTKNVISITHAQLQRWLQGEHLELAQIPDALACAQGAFVVVRCGDDFVGCGKIHGTEVHNYIPKTRYIHALYEKNV